MNQATRDGLRGVVEQAEAGMQDRLVAIVNRWRDEAAEPCHDPLVVRYEALARRHQDANPAEAQQYRADAALWRRAARRTPSDEGAETLRRFSADAVAGIATQLRQCGDTEAIITAALEWVGLVAERSYTLGSVGR